MELVLQNGQEQWEGTSSRNNFSSVVPNLRVEWRKLRKRKKQQILKLKMFNLKCRKGCHWKDFGYCSNWSLQLLPKVILWPAFRKEAWDAFFNYFSIFFAHIFQETFFVIQEMYHKKVSRPLGCYVTWSNGYRMKKGLQIKILAGCRTFNTVVLTVRDAIKMARTPKHGHETFEFDKPYVW